MKLPRAAAAGDPAAAGLVGREDPAGTGLARRVGVRILVDVLQQDQATMRIAIVGAGFAGVGAAKVLSRFGHDVAVFERCPDVGGVWSATRRYPGLRVQNVRSTYAFSDFPWPPGMPEWPTGEQVQAYLAAYVERFGLADRLRLGTEVMAAELDETEGSWTLQTRQVDSGTLATEVFDHLVVANGVFCDPLVPAFAGGAEHAAAGGRVLHTTQLPSLDEARGRHVLVVGYGKSACDVTEAVSDVAASTTVVARRLLWKMPRRVAGVLNYKYLLLTRLGEALFRHPEARRPTPLLHGHRTRLAARMLDAVQAVATRQDRLREVGLVPPGTFAELADSTGSLTTDRFVAKVRDGRIAVHRDAEIARLLAEHGRPLAELSDGARVPADLVLCGTGYHQRAPFLSEELQRGLSDEHGNFALFRHVLPVDVPHLTFAGYNSSFFSPLSAEIAALWIGSLLAGELTLPPTDEMRAQVRARLAWMEARTGGKHARGANIIPFSMHNIDELLADVGLDVSRVTRLRQWLLPIEPDAYRSIEPRLLKRRAASATSATASSPARSSLRLAPRY